MSNEFVLKASCDATSGIVAAVSSYLAEHDCYISEMHQFDDEENRRFFMRAECRIEGHSQTITSIRDGFEEQVARFNMDWEIFDKSEPVKVLLMVSKFDHCLDDLLYRHRKGELPMEITAVVSNHRDLRPMVEREGIRFVHLPVNKDNKLEQEAALLDIINETHTDLVVLARYMQILSDAMCKKLHGRAINIHHSFLPGFKGAKPYHQAHQRGVKLIGATAHYVTSDLDEGPIIKQSVQPVDHTYSPERLVAVGRDTETVALATAVRMHLEHRVFMYGNKTVVFK
ncbi:formyltetrahydrofolate deformylase [Marinomonas posidonica]|uniref:Formyltetrahydrofolate deformylase n=1 Tax=Marinomonas posidonica (strain CECT 7376 / NCIMB 14433 / IVIA-Po-181) TaxID=491952 RepID=F6CWX8_MARPP|nr:formyltetrahydrofolate deformylase [Marinomonas posidonica]AEF55540.1 formyltetrahydrofolate deformylase [Marinomonas posidonica IVIA-Po-181]